MNNYFRKFLHNGKDNGSTVCNDNGKQDHK